MSIRVRFRCGHEGTVAINAASTPVCACGETVIARTFARAPRFVGAVSGPYAETKSVDPGVVRLTDTPLILKES
jgi:hypothetical protein